MPSLPPGGGPLERTSRRARGRLPAGDAGNVAIRFPPQPVPPHYVAVDGISAPCQAHGPRIRDRASRGDLRRHQDQRERARPADDTHVDDTHTPGTTGAQARDGPTQTACQAPVCGDMEGTGGPRTHSGGTRQRRQYIPYAHRRSHGPRLPLRRGGMHEPAVHARGV
ncbi:hypothetical protein ON010_g12921 [Phytophthora cinnamomi]|nr:hypothetical protein ON010_g12921 [Phytophthora cinnamomi]